MEFLGGLYRWIARAKLDWEMSRVPQTEGERKAAMTRCPPGWSWVKTVGSGGRILEEGWEYRPPPDLLEGDGLSQIRPYVDRLVGSESEFSSLILATSSDDEKAISLQKMEGDLFFNGHFLRGTRELEAKARALFEERGCSVLYDYLDDDGDRVLAWTLPNDSQFIEEIVQVFASEIEAISSGTPLQVAFEENKMDDRFAGEGSISFLMTYPIEDPTAPPPTSG